MSVVDSKPCRVLVIEDDTADRRQFRILLNNINFENKQKKMEREKDEKKRNKDENKYREVDFLFAWDAHKKRIPDLDEIFRMIKESKIELILLDLAWTKRDEQIMKQLILLGHKKIGNSVVFTRGTEFPKVEDKDSVETRDQENYNPVRDEVGGFRFLERASHDSGFEVPVWIITAYALYEDMGVIEYCTKEWNPKKSRELSVFKKWSEDREYLQRKLKKFLEVKD